MHCYRVAEGAILRQKNRGCPIPAPCSRQARESPATTAARKRLKTLQFVTATRTILAAFVLLLIVSISAVGQEDTIRRGVTTEGTEFWIAFQKNFRDFVSDSDRLTPAAELELALFITSTVRAEGTIEIEGIGFRRDFVIEAGTVVRIEIDSAAQIRSSEVAEELAVHVVSDQPIAVYGLSHRYQTTDTYLAYPVSVLGTRYRAMGYKWLADDLLSQFAVIATEDDTEVTITPSVKTKNGRPAGKPFTVTLDRGQVYQVIPTFNAMTASDLTGSLIEANKPIAVFSGHNCAYVPDNKYKACNILVEQMPPIQSWGRQFFVGTLSGRTSSVLRVLATEDGTEVFENNSLVATLDAGEHYENPNLRVNTMLTSSRPVLVAQFSKGFTMPDAVTRRADSIGDPMMIVVAPTEQFLSRYRFATPETGDWNHYINLIVPTEAIGSMRLNQEPIDPGRFTTFGISRYSIARLRLPEGTYMLEGSQPFGLYSYGFGFGSKDFDAYGNGGGQSMLTIVEVPDRLPPTISAASDRMTGAIKGVVRDDRVNDSGIEEIDVLDFSNLTVEVAPFEKGAPQAAVNMRVVTDGQDGFALFRLRDRAGNVAERIVCVQYDEFGDSVIVTVPPEGESCSFAPPIYLGGDFRYSVLDNGLEIAPGDALLGNPVLLRASYGEPQYGIAAFGSMPFGRAMRLSGRVGLDFYSIRAFGAWPNDEAPRTDDGQLVAEEFEFERSTTFLSLTPGLRYYPLGGHSYVLGALNIGIPLGIEERMTRRIVHPSSFVYSNGSNEQVMYEGDGPSGAPIVLSPEIGVGADVPVPGGWNVVGELGAGFGLTSISPGRSDGGSWLFARFGLSRTFRF